MSKTSATWTARCSQHGELATFRTRADAKEVIARHKRVMHYVPGTRVSLIDMDPVEVGKRQKKFADLKAKKTAAAAEALAQKRVAVETARHDAMVALDAWLQAGRPTWGVGSGGPDDVWTIHKIYHLEDLALADYKMRHPTARGAKAWIFRAHVRGNRSSAARGGGSVVCRYCAAVLVPETTMGTYHGSDPVVATHATECALRSLGGQVVALAPGAVRVEDVIDLQAISDALVDEFAISGPQEEP